MRSSVYSENDQSERWRSNLDRHESPLSFDSGEEDSRPVLVVLHGLTGGSHESSAGATEDIRVVISYLKKKVVSPDVNLHAIGFSLGANVLTKYLGEEQDRSVIKSAVVVGNPWDLYAGHIFLESSFLGKIYSRALASNLRGLMKRHIHNYKTRKARSISGYLSSPSMRETTIVSLDSIPVHNVLDNPFLMVLVLDLVDIWVGSKVF
ncbi:hypothetical protein KEM48_013149 [Puccinia striiformis f. sp. tritici PST-130]|nr:hypothetical protein KEM48_013149 [Puccinia striiformis f. sp. tritici PST-130]